MDSRTITLIASIAIIGLVAVGVGYAYTALTVNEDNTATAQYVTLTQNTYTFTATPQDLFNTATDKTHSGNTTGYAPTTPVAGISSHYLVSLGTVQITATATGFTTDPSLVLTIDNAKGANFTPGTKLTYYLVKGTDVVAKLTAANTWKDATNTSNNVSIAFDALSSHTATMTLQLCYGYVNEDASAQGYGLWTLFDTEYVMEQPQDLSNGKIVFSATAAS